MTLRDVLGALMVAILVCAVRLALFDGQFFSFTAIPNHDTLSAAASFTSSMHALRLEGDIAWWLPADDGGYPQYFNHFFSPLAPTAANPLFLAWAAAVWALSRIQIVIPEYLQFLAFNWILTPTLLYWVLLLLLRQMCVTWTAALVALCGYAFGGAGLWNNAWMFYQEWLGIFLLCLALHLAIEAFSPPRLALLGLAVVYMVSSANYWTIFSSWLVLALLGASAWFFFDRFRSAAIRNFRFIRTSVVAWAVVSVVASICIGWVILFWLAYAEQAPVLVRGDSQQLGFTLIEAYERATALVDIRSYTVDLFNPNLHFAQRETNNPLVIHYARYVGATLLPPFACFFFQRWSRFDLVLFSVFLFTLMVATTAGFLLVLWDWTPGMKMVRHTFYFYQYFLEVSVALMAARGLDRILIRRDTAWLTATILGALLILAVAGFSYLFLDIGRSAPGDDSIKGIGAASLLVSLSCLLIGRARLADRRQSRALAALFVLISIGDLTHYYWNASRADQKFTLTLRGLKLEDGHVPAPIAHAMRQSWSVHNPQSFDGTLIGNMPIGTGFWPWNGFNPSAASKTFYALPENDRVSLAPKGSINLVHLSLAEARHLKSSPHPEHLQPSTSGITGRFVRWGYNRSTLQLEAEQYGLGSVLNKV